MTKLFLGVVKDNNNYLLNLGKKIKAEIIEHRNYIGGRYSVFSEAGMLPAYLMGLNPKNFKKNLPKFLNSKKILHTKKRVIY